MVKVDLSGAKGFFSSTGPDFAAASEAHRTLTSGVGAGNDFTGWLNLPARVAESELAQIISAAERIRSQSQALVVIGIGGSYLGARAAIEMLRSPNHNALPTGDPKVFFIGNGLSPDAMSETLAMLENLDFSVNVISKSGTTLEPALAFRVFKELLEKKYGVSEARKRIYATTDSSKGALKSMADSNGFETFVVPDDVGGRYSVLSAVGLLPMAVAGIDISRVVRAAIDELHALDLRSPDNPAWQYAAARQHLYQQGKAIEILASYDPAFHYMSEWWKQLFGESEGKNGVGIFPAAVDYTADLHSMGQYIQDGPRHIMETVISFAENRTKFDVPFIMGDNDGLNYLAGQDMGSICRTAAEAVKAAHISGGVPNISIEAAAKDEAGFASLVCFFELSCAISGYMLNVNPFDQPGVEAYKSNMFTLLGKSEQHPNC